MDVVNFLKDKTRIPVIGAPLFTSLIQSLYWLNVKQEWLALFQH